MNKVLVIGGSGLVGKPMIEPSEFYQVDSEFHSICFDFEGKTRLWKPTLL
ncbi:MAG: hypothetical protein N2B06_18805 [Clostridium sp.]